MLGLYELVFITILDEGIVAVTYSYQRTLDLDSVHRHRSAI